MKITEILQEQQTKGTYAAVKFNQATKDSVAQYIDDNDIPNGVNVDKLHCTLLYSRKYCEDYTPMGKIDPPWIGTPTKLDVWESKENSTKCLVLEFECDELVERHKQLMKEHEATYDFPQYKTHITLSYDIGDLVVSSLPDVSETIDKIHIVQEYGEDLKTDWAKTSTKDD